MMGDITKSIAIDNGDGGSPPDRFVGGMKS